MKTAISIPDPLFRKAERLARRLRLSRSALYAKAVQAMVEAHGRGNITARINAALGPNDEGDPLDRDIQEAALQTLERIEWDEAR